MLTEGHIFVYNLNASFKYREHHRVTLPGDRPRLVMLVVYVHFFLVCSNLTIVNTCLFSYCESSLQSLQAKMFMRYYVWLRAACCPLFRILASMLATCFSAYLQFVDGHANSLECPLFRAVTATEAVSAGRAAAAPSRARHLVGASRLMAAGSAESTAIVLASSPPLLRPGSAAAAPTDEFADHGGLALHIFHTFPLPTRTSRDVYTHSQSKANHGRA